MSLDATLQGQAVQFTRMLLHDDDGDALQGTGRVQLVNRAVRDIEFIVTGNDTGEGTDTAAALGVSTGLAGVASSTVASDNLQHQYISLSTQLGDLNNGRGVGTGRFRISDATGATAVIDIGDDSRTIGDVLKEINSAGIGVEARINSTGDGIEIVEDAGGPAGGVKIKIEDEAGNDDIDLAANPVARVFVQNFIVLFNGDLAELRRRYEPTFKVDGERWSLTLVPKAAPLARLIESIEMRGDAAGMRSMTLREEGGDTTETVFENLDTRHRFSESEIADHFATATP